MGPRVWVVSEMYFPEETSTAHFLTRIAERLGERYEVHALCAQPTYSRRGSRGPSRELRNGVRITRCLSTTLDKDVLVFKVVNLLTISVSLFLHALRALRRGDVALVVTNPPPLPLLILLACKARGAACVLLLHDVFPDALVATRMAGAGSWAVRLFDGLTRRMYRGMSRLAVLGRDMAALVERKIGGEARDRIVVIPNWSDVNEIHPESKRVNPLALELGIDGRFVLQYAGNMGRMYDIELLAEAARCLAQSDPDVHFLFVGSGAKRRWLEDYVRQQALPNVTILAPKPRSEQQVFLNACDVAITALVPGMSGVGVPSRLYNILASGRPTVAATDVDSELTLVLREEGVGWATPPGRADLFVAAVQEAKRDAARLEAMGARARRVAEEKYAAGKVLERYGELVEEVLASRAEGGS